MYERIDPIVITASKTDGLDPHWVTQEYIRDNWTYTKQRTFTRTGRRSKLLTYWQTLYLIVRNLYQTLWASRWSLAQWYINYYLSARMGTTVTMPSKTIQFSNSDPKTISSSLTLTSVTLRPLVSSCVNRQLENYAGSAILKLYQTIQSLTNLSWQTV